MEELWSSILESRKVKDPEKLKLVREAFGTLADLLQDELPDGRYKSIVKTDLEKLSMVITKCLTHG